MVMVKKIYSCKVIGSDLRLVCIERHMWRRLFLKGA